MTMLVKVRADGQSIGEALGNLDRLLREMGLLAEGLPEHGVGDDGRDIVRTLARFPNARKTTSN